MDPWTRMRWRRCWRRLRPLIVATVLAAIVVLTLVLLAQYACLLGIEIAHQLGRALDVREQRRYRLALAFDRIAGRLLRHDTNI